MPAGCYYEEGETEYQHFHLQFSIYKGHVAILYTIWILVASIHMKASNFYDSAC